MKPIYRRMLKGMKAKPPARGAAPWHLYILRCGDGSFYTGVTTDVERRVREHAEGRASRYTRTHGPVELIFAEEVGDRSQALSRECAVKSLPRAKKEALVAAGPTARPRPTRKRAKTSKPAGKRPS